jgi:hypothetical protein
VVVFSRWELFEKMMTDQIVDLCGKITSTEGEQ